MYNIGQVVYIYKETNDTLFPCVICEEVVKKTLQGEDVYYKILLPDQEGTVVDLSKLDVKVFGDLVSFKEDYISRANARVDDSIKNCEKICLEKFNQFKKSENKTNKPKEKKDTKNKEVIVVEDENNIKLNIDMSKLEELGLWVHKEPI